MKEPIHYTPEYLDSMPVGESIVYHEGFLPRDRVIYHSAAESAGIESARIDNLARELMRRSTALYYYDSIEKDAEKYFEAKPTGEFQLSQIKIRAECYYYIAKKVKQLKSHFTVF